jgi:thioredoxin 1
MIPQPRQLPALFVAATVMAALAACGSSTKDDTAAAPATSASPSSAMTGKAMADGEKMDEKMADGDKMANGEKMDAMVSATDPGQYLDYADYKGKEANFKATKVVFFFHAPWCPSCKATEKDILENKSKLPAGLTIVKVDYDSTTDLKRKYGVTAQHTFVKVDAQGNELKQWAGTLSASDIAAKAA